MSTNYRSRQKRAAADGLEWKPWNSGAVVAFALLPLLVAASYAQSPVPDDFPRFVVPGHEGEMDSLRRLYWLHYPGAGPKATMWDEWLPMPSLWPAVETDGMSDRFRAEWARTLSERRIDPEGYVVTNQHASIAHQDGWPFPFWKQGGPDTWGWHFSLSGVPSGWHGTEEKTQEGWTTSGVEDLGIENGAWNLRLAEPGASVTTPAMRVDVLQSPFVQLRWRAKGLGNAQPFLEWRREEDAEWGPDRRMYFPPVEGDGIVYTMIPVFTHPAWTGVITQLRIGFGNAARGAEAGIQALFTQYDTRHTINNSAYLRGCAAYFLWTRDLNFLRQNINKMRLALRYNLTEYSALKDSVIVTPYVGHDGRPGILRLDNGVKALRFGRGIGGNYWDLIPFGHKDAYATIYHYAALQSMLDIERAILANPGWNIPGGALRIDLETLQAHAKLVRDAGNKLFWNKEAGRFIPCVDADGKTHDYGLTFLNLEAIHYGFATTENAAAIMDWITGARSIDGDTSQGADIYAWRFGPRATTKRNLDYYGWYWSAPESIAWGDQVQDGGAVLGFSYHDLMARLRVLGPDNAAARLAEIAAWFDEISAAGGYRAYYDGSRPGTLQGGGTPGGLGLDHEFFESVLVPQVMLEGFMGFRPTSNGFSLAPKLPAEWSELTIDRVRVHGATLTLRAAHDSLDVRVEASSAASEATLTMTLLSERDTAGAPARVALKNEPGSHIRVEL